MQIAAALLGHKLKHTAVSLAVFTLVYEFKQHGKLYLKFGQVLQCAAGQNNFEQTILALF